MSEFAGLKGIIFDYGGTIDSRGTHWSEVIWDAYVACGVKVDKAVFRDAYVHAERELARVRHILPQDDFYTLLLKKMRIELAWLIEGGHITCDQPEELAQALAHYCDDRARECIAEARPVLEALAERFPLMLVSNFYGNVDTVLHTYDVRRYFKGVIESHDFPARHRCAGTACRAGARGGRQPAQGHLPGRVAGMPHRVAQGKGMDSRRRRANASAHHHTHRATVADAAIA